MIASGQGTSPDFTSGGEDFRADAGQGPSPYGALNADDRGGVGPNGKDSLTPTEAAAQIGRENLFWANGLGQSATVTFAFRAEAPTVMPSDTAGFSRFTEVQISATLQALAAWSDVANITFQRVGDYSNDATILFGNYGSGEEGAAAFAFMPGSRAALSASGDVWVDNGLNYNANPVMLGYGQQVLTHEIGHAIGLSHPAAYNAEEGVTITYAVDATYYEDSRQYTVMSYFGEGATGGGFGGRYAAAPLLDDIAAIQRLYGANMSTRAGDTVYGFNSNAGQPWLMASGAGAALIFAAWDAGGNDIFDFSGYGQNQLIDLRQGAFSDVGGLTGNVAVAMGATIENAIGGAGADVLRGNAQDNHLTGGAGNDVIDGGLGSDTAVFSGVRAAYTITYAGQTASVSGPDGTDTVTNVEFLRFADQTVATTPTGGLILSGDVNANIIGGTAFADSLSGLGGNDALTGLGGNDSLIGGDGADTLAAGEGDDFMNGGAGADRLDGGAGWDIVTYVGSSAGVTVSLVTGTATGGDGADVLVGVEEVRGSPHDDLLIGGAGADILRGGGGIDRIDAGDGDDTLRAGAPGESGGAADIVKSAATANISVATAVSLDGGFDLRGRPDVGTSTTIPHATVTATVHGGAREYYAVTVTAGARAVFDIDAASFDSTLRLFDAQGSEVANNDDGGGDGFNATDSSLSFTFAAGGVYYLEVAEWSDNVGATFNSIPASAGDTYTLHVSLTGHPVVAATLVGSTLNGQNGDDYLYGGAGDDLLTGGAGSDTIDGGGGIDTLVLANPASTYVLQQTAAGWTVSSTGGTDTVTNVEQIQFAGGAVVAISSEVGAQFDPLVYIASNPDLIVAYGLDTAAATLHYETFQALNPRAINSFNGLVYSASNLDLGLGTDAVAATRQYIEHGYFEGRPTDSFNPLIYAASSRDLAQVFGADADAATIHYLTYAAQHTHPVSGFDAVAYLLSYGDLAGLTPTGALNHWLQSGADDNRVGDALFGREQAGHALDGSASGAIETAGDRDWFQVNMGAGQRVTLNLAGDGSGGLRGGDLSLYDGFGRLVASSADGSSTASLSYAVSAAGTYYVVVTGGGGAGAYQLGAAFRASADASADVAAPDETKEAASSAPPLDAVSALAEHQPDDAADALHMAMAVTAGEAPYSQLDPDVMIQVFESDAMPDAHDGLF